MMPLIHLDFELRRDYIYQVLCINRDKPMTVCGGECYLNDRLGDLAQQQEKNNETSNRSQSFSFFNEEIGEIEMATSVLELGSSFSTPYALGSVVGFNANLFRPPRFL